MVAAAPVAGPLAPTAQLVVGHVLQDTLVDLVDLSLLAGQARWNVVGRDARECRLHLAELEGLARRSADDVAERPAAVGVAPDGRSSTVAKTSGIATLDAGRLPVGEVTDSVVDVLVSLVPRLRAGIATTAEHDLVTQDLLVSVAAAVEHASWMWQAAR